MSDVCTAKFSILVPVGDSTLEPASVFSRSAVRAIFCAGSDRADFAATFWGWPVFVQAVVTA